MRILLIKPKQIGDSLIFTPTIRAIKLTYPEAEIWVVVRRGCESILAGCPDIARILLTAPVEKRERRAGDWWNDFKTGCAIATHRFYCAFELGDGTRGRRLLRLASFFCRRRYSVKPTDPWGELAVKKGGGKVSSFNWQTCHRVEKDFRTVSEFLTLPEPVPPMVFEPARATLWEPGRDLADFAVVQVGTRQGFNRWHRDGWRDVCRALLKTLPHVVITCGPVQHERDEAASLRQELGGRVLTTDGRASWPEIAWLLARAKLYVGPNTAAMHLAAACRCPVIALFGPSIEDHWHPWQVPYRIVTSPGYQPVADARERYARVKKRKMEEIRAEDVIAACEDLLRETAPFQP